MSPSNLIVSLKLTADLWSREYQNRHAQEIAERGAKLYDKCVAFSGKPDRYRRQHPTYRRELSSGSKPPERRKRQPDLSNFEIERAGGEIPQKGDKEIPEAFR